MRRLSSLALLLVLLLPAGCATRGLREDLSRRSFYLDTHAGLSVTMRQAIESGLLLPGMSRDMVLASVGVPSRTAPAANGRQERWEYADGGYDAVVTTLTFEGDLVVSIEQTQPVMLAVAQARMGMSAGQPLARGAITRVGLK